MKFWNVAISGSTLGAIVAMGVFLVQHPIARNTATEGSVNSTMATINGNSGLSNSTTNTSGTSQSSGSNTNDAESTGGVFGMSTVTTQQVLSAVQQMLQKTPTKSLDASGFVQSAYGDAGVTLPRTIADQAQIGIQIDSQNRLHPGDLVFFDLDSTADATEPTFDGIYIGNGQFAARTTQGIETIDLSSSYWASHFLYGVKVP